MVDIAKECLEFLVVFILVYIVSYLFTFKKLKKFNRKTAPLNIKYLIFKYNIDVVKIGYKELEKKLIMADSFIISFIFLLTMVVDNIYLRLLVAFIFIFPVFAGVYHLIAMYYKKKENE